MVRCARSVITQQSGGCALPWSGAHAVLERSSRAGALCHGQACAQCYTKAACAQRCNEALTMVRRAITKQSSGCGYHGQACAQHHGEAVVRALCSVAGKK